MNKLSTDQHPLIQADVIKWLYDAPNAIYDLVLLDPPTFSNSARTDTVWDIKKDAAVLLAEVHRVLESPAAPVYSQITRVVLSYCPKLRPYGVRSRPSPIRPETKIAPLVIDQDTKAGG